MSTSLHGINVTPVPSYKTCEECGNDDYDTNNWITVTSKKGVVLIFCTDCFDNCFWSDASDFINSTNDFAPRNKCSRCFESVLETDGSFEHLDNMTEFYCNVCIEEMRKDKMDIIK